MVNKQINNYEMCVCVCVCVCARARAKERETESEYGLVGGFKGIST